MHILQILQKIFFSLIAFSLLNIGSPHYAGGALTKAMRAIVPQLRNDLAKQLRSKSKFLNTQPFYDSHAHVSLVARRLLHTNKTNAKNQNNVLSQAIRFCRAAKKGNRDEVKDFLQAGVSPNIQDKDGWTPLHIAAAQGHKEIVAMLLSKGASTSTVEKTYGVAPLYLAAQNGHKEVVEMLLDAGAHVDAVEKTYGAVPLHAAAKNGHEEIITVLIDKGANVNIRGRNGLKPLHVALLQGHKKIVTLLMNKDSD